MNEHLLVDLALVVILGISAQWLAWQIKLPSILLLLLTGIVVGPVTGLLNTEGLLGDLLFPFVSLSVAVILFEGGLSLRFEDVRETRRTVQSLITIGAVVTWLTTTAAAYWILGLNVELSLLLGATLVVTGPTVVTPLLAQIRPAPRVGSLLRWEGIIIDPVGAVLAVLVFEEIIAEDSQLGISQAIISIIEILAIGSIIGISLGKLLLILLDRYWIPDRLQSSVSLMAVIGAFVVSNLLQAESGLLTVTVMGMVMTNQKRVNLEPIIEFKENLQVLLISALFILLAARIKPDELTSLGLTPIWFIAALILLIRPLSVWVATFRSVLTWQERVFVAWMAPRGIVAASVASIFSLELIEHGYEGAEILTPVTFMVIISTVIIYGLTAELVAKRLGLIQDNPQGVMIIGAHDWVRMIAQEIKKAGFRVLLIDTNSKNVQQAWYEGLEALHANAVSTLEQDTALDLSGIGYLMAMTPNDAVNALANVHYHGRFRAVYQLSRRGNSEEDNIPKHIGGNYLFKKDMTFDDLTIRFNKGANIQAICITDPDTFRHQSRDGIVPLFMITDEGELVIWTDENPPQVLKEHTLVVMIDPAKEDDILQNQEIVEVESLKPLVTSHMKELFRDEQQ